MRPITKQIRKELIAQYFPMKLIGGFIALDFHVGCMNCAFCVCKRNKTRKLIFDTGLQGDFSVGVDEILDLLRKMPSFTKARVPLRFGHDTDAMYQKRQFWEMYEQLPENYPVVQLRRSRISEDEVPFYKRAKRNLLVKMTVTPNSRWYRSLIDPYRALESLLLIPNTTKYILIGPLADDSFDQAMNLISILPVPSIVDVKALNLEGLESLPEIVGAIPLDNWRLALLRTRARDLGHWVTSHLTCPLRHNLGIPFDRVGDLDEKEREHCNKCYSYSLCYSNFDEAFFSQQIESCLEYLQLTKVRAKCVGMKQYVLDVNEPTAMGDYTYMSKLLGAKIKITSSRRGTLRGETIATPDVLARWERVGFYPVRELREITIRTYQNLGFSWI